jgi:catechol 2,3-dioxygenase-like lactoylglutathione lyase family enzyme
MPRITTASVFVDDQAKALAFYTGALGFVVRDDVPLGPFRWLTVVSPEDPDGAQLLLEPDEHPAAKAFAAAIRADGIPAASLGVRDREDLEAVYAALLAAGARVTQPPTDMGPVTTLVVDDTCGNLIQLATPPRVT